MTVMTIGAETQADPLLVHSNTKIVPILTIAERYDSNVFFVPGENVQDYVTTVTPQVRVEHTGRLVAGTLTGTLVGEHYAKNAGLDYIAPSAAINLNLDNLLGQIDKNAKLTITDRFAATPQPLAFIGPQTGNEVPDAFVRGIQAARANTRTNMVKAIGAYELTPASSLQLSYMYSTFEYGQKQATPTLGGFFNTTYQTLTGGPQVRVSPVDTLGVNYQYVQSSFTSGSGMTSATSGFTTHGGTATWQRLLTPTLIFNGAAGATVMQGIGAPTLQYLADAQLEWKFQNGGAKLHYSRTIFPSFFIAATPLLSQVTTLSVSYTLTADLIASSAISYAINESVGNALLRYESKSASLSFNYLITRWLTGIAAVRVSSYNSKFGATEMDFDRNTVTLSLRGAWD
jgi:hypothetical protein